MSSCTVCGGSGTVKDKNGNEVSCTNCNGTGESSTDPRD